MHYPTKIKSQILVLTIAILLITFLLQIGLHDFMQRKSSDAVSSLLDSVLQNTASQIEDLNADISETSFFLTIQEPIQSIIFKYTKHPEIIQNMSRTKSLLDNYRERNRNIAFLGLYKNSKLFMSSKTEELDSYAYDLLKDSSENKTLKEGFFPSFIHSGHTYFTYITPIFPVNDPFSNREQPDDFIVCIYEINSVNFGAYNFIDNNQFQMVITDSENHIMFSSDPTEHGIDFKPDTMKKFLYKTAQIKNADWKITIYHPDNYISRALGWSPFYLVFMLAITLCMIAIMYLSLNKIYVKKILILKEKAKKIPTQDITYRIQYKYDDELKEIAMVFNQILENLHTLNSEKLNSLNTLHKAQLMQKETQMLLMHSQVSPHFLYNAMSYIQGVAFEYNATEIVKMASALSKVFRYYSSGGTQSTVVQDLNCAIEYFNVINLHRKNKITLTNTVSKELLNIRCPKMIYQPILENVLKHAFDIEESGSVTISSVPDDKKAIIEITDNGCGITEEALSNINELLSICDTDQIPENYEHVGLLNVHMRLKLYYNEDCGIKITSSPAGTSVHIIIDKDSQNFKAGDIYLAE